MGEAEFLGETKVFDSKYEILGVEWRSSIHIIGVIAYKKEDGWQAVIGMAGSMSDKMDAYMICAYGAKLKKAEAIAFFPSLNPKQCKND